jgi:hypothetical protein
LTKLKSISTQGRLDGFFKALPKDPTIAKRKLEVPKAKDAKKKGKK